MLASLFLTVIDALVSLFTGMLLMRFVMQWQRVTFRNPLGQFVLATTDWLVVPVRRVIPGLFGFDMASLLPAWILQALVVFLTLMVRGSLGLMDPLGLVLVVWGVGLLGVAKTVLYLVMGVVLMSAVFSWVNPHAPLAGVVYALSEHALLGLTGDHPENPTFSLPCREVFARGQRRIEVLGPMLEDEAAAPHAGFWG